VAAVVQDACQRFTTLANEKNIALTCRIPEHGDFHANVDSIDLRNCVDNLIDNAIKYTPGPGTVSVTVSLGTGANGTARAAEPDEAKRGGAQDRREHILVSVADSGVGIDPRHLTGSGEGEGIGSIFDAFRRGNEALAGNIPGTGLGLSIVREVVEQSGGQIRVHSRPGEGSTFTVSFPAHQTSTGSETQPTVRDTRSSEIVVEEARPVAAPSAAGSAEEPEHAG
jgi:signal transduction histidine kinase